MNARQFTASPAVRKNVPLLLALIGPSGGGKSYSALRLASGIARAQSGPVFVIDTEADRALQYADKFTFQHVPFDAPFGSLDYLAALQSCERAGARTIIVDSMSHEHEGPGGMLDAAERFLEERCGDDWKKRDRLKLMSYIAPKSARQKLIQGMLQLKCNLVLCFRAKEKMRPQPGKEPLQLGWQPIGGDEFWYEMSARALLLPGANGVPTWNPIEVGEKMAARRPEQFLSILRDGQQLSEDMGEAMARWAAGDPVTSPRPATTQRQAPASTARPASTSTEQAAPDSIIEAVRAATTVPEVDELAKSIATRSAGWTQEQHLTYADAGGVSGETAGVESVIPCLSG